jgi:hypothetical protein
MLHRHSTRLALTLSVAVNSALSAQSAPPIDDTVTVRAGDWVRLRPVGAHGQPPLTGRATRVQPEAVWLRLTPGAASAPVLLAREDVLWVARRRAGFRQRAWRATLLGSVSVGALGFLLADRLHCRPARNLPPGVVDLSCDSGWSRSDLRQALTLGGAVVGGGIGAVGWRLHERAAWVPARVP